MHIRRAGELTESGPCPDGRAALPQGLRSALPRIKPREERPGGIAVVPNDGSALHFPTRLRDSKGVATTAIPREPVLDTSGRVRLDHVTRLLDSGRCGEWRRCGG